MTEVILSLESHSTKHNVAYLIEGYGTDKQHTHGWVSGTWLKDAMNRAYRMAHQKGLIVTSAIDEDTKRILPVHQYKFGDRILSREPNSMGCEATIEELFHWNADGIPQYWVRMGDHCRILLEGEFDKIHENVAKH